ncbi:MAG: hypothetical protein JWO13_3606 [Acidobacteriales bacterium]|nr:hypothetical protein [Terriglobales bacterium]
MADKEFLNSWKEVAQFVGRSERTIQRWEREWGFPVHRPAGRLRSSVIALPAEIQHWIEKTPLVHSLPSLASSVTLLCIDENVESLESRKSFFENQGFKVLVATESARAIQLFERSWVDLVILSMALQSTENEVLARMLRRRNPKIPIIMLSGREEPPHSVSLLVQQIVEDDAGNAGLLSAINQYIPRQQRTVSVSTNGPGISSHTHPSTRTKR